MRLDTELYSRRMAYSDKNLFTLLAALSSKRTMCIMWIGGCDCPVFLTYTYNVLEFSAKEQFWEVSKILSFDWCVYNEKMYLHLKRNCVVSTPTLLFWLMFWRLLLGFINIIKPIVNILWYSFNCVSVLLLARPYNYLTT